MADTGKKVRENYKLLIFTTEGYMEKVLTFYFGLYRNEWLPGVAALTSTGAGETRRIGVPLPIPLITMDPL